VFGIAVYSLVAQFVGAFGIEVAAARQAELSKFQQLESQRTLTKLAQKVDCLVALSELPMLSLY
jgi:hypothetical protein